MSMKTHFRHIISIGLLFASLVGSGGALAVDCPQNSYTLTTQAAVDAFPQGCDSLLGGLTVGNSTDITNLDGLANLTSVGGDLSIPGNGSLTNLDGLVSLTSLGGGLSVFGNGSLTNLDGLANLTSVGGDLSIKSNGSLTNLDGLANLTSVGGDLNISGNGFFTNLDGLVSLTSLGGGLYINFERLTNLDGLANLTSVGGLLSILGNDALTNLDGLANLTSVGGGLSIQSNTRLTNCQGIAPVLGWPSGPPDDSVGGGITIGPNNVNAECDSVAAVLASVSGPSQPVINTATGGNESISLAFSPSTTPDVLFPITGYEAACTADDELVVTNNASSPITVSGLTGGKEYSCTVAPVTNLGAAPLSNAVSATATAPVIPSTPQITNTDYGDGEIYLTVSDSGGSSITGYTATCTDGTTEYTGTSTTSFITVSGLTNGVGYSCSVTATNAAGTSTSSAPSPPITPEEFIATGLPIWLLYDAAKPASP